MKILLKLLAFASPIKSIIWTLITRIAAAFLTKRMAIWVMSELAKRTEWRWDDAVVRLLVAADSGTTEDIQNAIISLEAAAKLDYADTKTKSA